MEKVVATEAPPVQETQMEIPVRAPGKRSSLRFYRTNRKSRGSRMSTGEEEYDEVDIEAIRAALMSSQFDDRLCDWDSKAGARRRRKGRLQSFDPALLLTDFRIEDLFEFDQYGWAPIHYCAFRGFDTCIWIIINEIPALIEYKTRDAMRTTPLLLAVMSGNVKTMKLFFRLGANVQAVDSLRHNIIALCTFKQAIDIIQFFIRLNHPQLPVWKLLVQALGVRIECDALAAAKTIRKMTDLVPPWMANRSWRPANDNQITKSINRVLGGTLSDMVKEETLHVLLNILAPLPVKRAAVEDGLLPIIIATLLVESEVLIELAALTIGEICKVPEFAEIVFELGVVETLVDTFARIVSLKGITAVTAVLGYLMGGREKFKSRFGETEPSISMTVKRFHECTSKRLFFSLLMMARNAMEGHRANQDRLCDAGLCRYLVRLTKAKNRKLMMTTLATIRAISKDNPHTQHVLIELGVVWPIVNILKKSRYLSIQELTAKTLWTIAGVDIEERWKIAEVIGVRVLVEFVQSTSDVLNFVGADGIGVLASAPLGAHDAISQASGMLALIQLIRRTTREDTVLVSIRTIQYCCFKAGLVHHPANQKAALGEGAVPGAVEIFVDFLNNNNFEEKELVKAESAFGLGCIAMDNMLCLKKILGNKKFSYCLITNLLKSVDERVQALAGAALAAFCYNKTGNQSDISNYKGVYFCRFEKLMNATTNDMIRCQVGFQLVVLARVFPDKKPAFSAATGLVMLSELLNLPKSNDILVQGRTNAVIAQTANYIAALTHSRAGIPEAFLAIRVLEALCRLLLSPYEHIRAFSAIALGYLSMNPEARRIMLRKFRQDVYLLEIMLFYTQDNKFCALILEDWVHYVRVGLPPKDLSRGVLIRARVVQDVGEARPYILTGIEDPASGAVGAVTAEKDDYDDDVIMTDDPPRSRKKKKEHEMVLDEEEAEVDERADSDDMEENSCLVELRMERERAIERAKEEELRRRLEEEMAEEEEEEEEDKTELRTLLDMADEDEPPPAPE